jgi:copper(I)-binding protein
MKTFTALLALALSVAPAAAAGVKIGDIVIDNAWARATPKGAEVGGGYLTIRNDGATPDRLTGGDADFAGVQVHQMTMTNGVMQMREVQGGVEIPAHATVKLAPSGYHLMFVGLKKPLVKGETAKATLNFERAGRAEVDFPVLGVGASGPGGAMGAMKGM